MLATLAGFCAITLVQNPQFPKPDSTTPAALRDRTIFKYLSDQDMGQDFRPFTVGPDWSNLTVPAAKPTAQHFKVLLAVAERDFSDPHYSNILESRDKTRLLEAAARLKSLYLAASDGNVVVDIVPRFYTEAMYSVKDFTDLVDNEFNRGKFEIDNDSIDRGPFGAVLAISSSHVEPLSGDHDYILSSFADLGGSSEEMTLEANLYRLTQLSLKKRLARRMADFAKVSPALNIKLGLMDPVPGVVNGVTKFLDPTLRQDADLLASWIQAVQKQSDFPQTGTLSAVSAPGKVELKDDSLNFSEVTLMRSGGFALPVSSKFETSKALTFEMKAATRNPIAVRVALGKGEQGRRTVEYVIGDQPGMIPFKFDNTWQAVTIPMETNGQPAVTVTVGTPSEFFGTTRAKAELTQYWFRGFDLSTIAVAPIETGTSFKVPNMDTEDAVRDVLTNGTRFEKRMVLANLDKIRTMKGLEPLLKDLTTDLDMRIAHDATRAYFDMVLSGQPTPEQIAGLQKYLSLAPNEASREVALEFAYRYPSYANFSLVSANTVRENWRVRMKAFQAMGPLNRANVREKLACKEFVRMATIQDLATIRIAGLEQFDLNVQADMDRMVDRMVNDACESVRLKALELLTAFEKSPKDKILGTLADDSPSFRERIPGAIGANSPFLRDVLDRLVVDSDPYVRAVALRGLAKLPSVQDGEIQSVFTDKHPAVQLALLEGAKAGKWKVSADQIATLKSSPFPSVAKLAGEL